MRRSLFALTAALTLVLSSTAQAADGDIIVQRESGLDSSERRELRADAGVTLVETLTLPRTELVDPRDGDVAEALAELRADENVVYAEPDRRVRAATNDFYWTSLWALSNSNDADIDGPEAWLRSVGTGVTVAVVDTGINAAHEDLGAQIVGTEQLSDGFDDDGNGFIDDVAGWDFVGPGLGNNEPLDGNGHGTHVAGTIAATGSNGAGVIGVAPESKILPLRALDEHGDGYTSDVAQAFDYAGNNGVRIVNASLGGAESATTLQNVIAAHPDTLYVIAAGNSNANNDVPAEASYPCAFPEANVLCVGATTHLDEKASFSSYGATTVDLSAPGVGILSAWHTSPTAYAIKQGTSMAAPHVAGAAALALAAAPGASTADLKSALMSSVDMKPALAGQSVTCGRLNADAAVAAITGQGTAAEPCPEPPAAPTPTPTPTPPVATPTPTAPVAPPTPDPPADATPAPLSPTPGPTTTPDTYLFDVTVGGSLATQRSKLRVRYALSRGADVHFTIARRGSKRPLASWTRHGRAGTNSTVITRRLPTGLKLKPGRYTLAVSLNANATTLRSLRVR